MCLQVIAAFLHLYTFHTYDLAWETAVRPIAVYIGFVKESDIQHLDANNVFHTPGIYYRPNQLKSMACLLGHTESRTVFNNFELENLNSNAMDHTHLLYERYLQNNFFYSLRGKKLFCTHEKNYPT